MVRFLCTCLFLSCLSGCVILPTHFTDDEPFREEDIGFLEVGATSKNEVRESIGEPRKSFLQGRWWVYRAHQKMFEWVVAMDGGGWEFGGETRQHNLLIHFDENNLVRHFEVLTAKSPCIQAYGLCYTEGYLQFESAEGMPTALNPVLCRAHVYVSNIVDPYKPVWVEIDGFEPAHTLVNHDSDYLLIALTPGSHELEISIDFLSNVFSETIIVNCNQNRAFYLSVLIEDSDIAFTKLDNENEGRKQIDKREPHLVADQD